MLEFLKINNVALIKNLELNLSKGFNVILGETGAGKSIIIDALNFVLGSKADKTIIRNGEEQMKVTAKFITENEKVFNLLNDFGIECDGGEVLLTRSYSQTGKGDARINGEIVTANTLREVGGLLVDAYSQNESISLLKQKNHLSILDSYKPSELKRAKEDISAIIDKLNELNKEIKTLGGSGENRERQIDLLKYQILEIEDANIQENEDEELNETLEKLSHAEKIQSALSTANESLNGEESSVLDLIKTTIRALSNIENFDDKVQNLNKTLNSLSLDLEDVSENLIRLSEDYNFDENALEKMVARREKLDSLKRKYGNNLEDINLFLTKSKEKLNRLENAEENLSLKEKEKKDLLDKVLVLMNELGKIRRKHALEIESKIVEGLAELGILKARFKINFFPLTESIFNLERYNINCLEDVEFLFSANYGEDLKPLAKTISGGEMNRFMLIFKNVIAEICGSETLIFDEIDSGISGKIANEVALKIAKLSKNYQVICITHLAQVASMGDEFYFVSKGQSGERTETQIKVLESSEIIDEIALLSYGKVDENSVSFAKNMLTQNKQIKLNIE
ncbi:MAG: DNA repair protein RecN [Clostridia bacterium]|nr:DNA repair protein RecN [Clostridia bacterium]